LIDSSETSQPAVLRPGNVGSLTGRKCASIGICPERSWWSSLWRLR